MYICSARNQKLIKGIMKNSFKELAFASAIILAAACTKAGNLDPANETINSKVVFVSPEGGTKVSWPNENQWADRFDVPSKIEDDEREYVRKYFEDHSTDRVGETTVDYKNFFVQHVWKGTSVYTLEDRNKAKHTVTGSNHMNQLRDGKGDDIYNFNAGQGTIMCMVDASTASFSYADSFGTNNRKGENNTRFNKYIMLDIPGYGVYLGFDYETYKTGEGIYFEGDGIYTDWIIKIVNADKKPGPKPDPKPVPDKGKGSIEFDIHQQIHKDWNEIKTSIHIRDTTNCRIVIPIPEAIQAQADDVVVRSGELYEYLPVEIEIGGKKYTMRFSVGHTEQGIEIVVLAADAQEALKAARKAYNDGLTFEIHTYVAPEVSMDEVWGYVKQTPCAQTSLNTWDSFAPTWQSVEKDVYTHTYGQITSATHLDQDVKYDYYPIAE